jgi:bla regulator protein blaR1
MHKDFTMNIAVRRMPKLPNIALMAALSLLCPVPSRSQSPPSSNTGPDKPVTALSQPPVSESSAKSDLPKFEVATIKPAAPSDNSMLMFTADGISIHGIPMKMLLRESFGVEDDRILGEPNWVKNRFDIEAKVDAEDAPKLKKMKFDQRRAMVLPLLEDRFNLKYHHETRELPMYALVVAKGGLKMKATAPDDPPKADSAPKPEDGDAKDKPRMGRHSLMMNGRGHLESTGTTTEMLSHVLARELGRTVVNKTDLTGNYDYTLQWTPDDVGTPMGGDAGPGKGDISPDAGGPTLLTALEEQLGLKLESQKGTVDVIVIDHIDLPSEN